MNKQIILFGAGFVGQYHLSSRRTVIIFIGANLPKTEITKQSAAGCATTLSTD